MAWVHCRCCRPRTSTVATTWRAPAPPLLSLAFFTAVGGRSSVLRLCIFLRTEKSDNKEIVEDDLHKPWTFFNGAEVSGVYFHINLIFYWGNSCILTSFWGFLRLVDFLRSIFPSWLNFSLIFPSIDFALDWTRSLFSEH